MNERSLTIMRMLNAKKKMKAKELADQFKYPLERFNEIFNIFNRLGFHYIQRLGLMGVTQHFQTASSLLFN
ncbi:hypothetical protein NLX69_11310 [Rossellomorea sp. BNER]|nr:hypothetical protein [Rossellomorea sp. BNER]